MKHFASLYLDFLIHMKNTHDSSTAGSKARRLSRGRAAAGLSGWLGVDEGLSGLSLLASRGERSLADEVSVLVKVLRRSSGVFSSLEAINRVLLYIFFRVLLIF